MVGDCIDLSLTLILDDGCNLTWFCTLDSNHTESNEEIELMVDRLDETIRSTVYFSSPADWERILEELQKTLHKGNTGKMNNFLLMKHNIGAWEDFVVQNLPPRETEVWNYGLR